MGIRHIIRRLSYIWVNLLGMSHS